MSRKNLRSLALAAAVVLIAAVCGSAARYMENRVFARLLEFLRTFLYLGLFFAWGISARRRVTASFSRNMLTAVAVMMILWFLLREFKWRFVTDPDLLRWLWYAFYVPLMAIPLFAFLISLSLGEGEKFRLPRWTWAIWAVTAAVILTVLTNDLHSLAFVFPAGSPRSEDNYTYGPAFFAAALWGVALAAAAFFIMLRRYREPDRSRRLLLPLLPFFAAVAYLVLYVLRIPILPGYVRDLAAFDCLVFTAFFESCIRAGLIQSNSEYFRLFKDSGDISAQILDDDLNVVYAARGAENVDREIIREAAEPVLLPSGKRLHKMRVRGGWAVWTEDISELLAVRETLELRQEELMERNALLELEYRREREHRAVEEQNRLYDLMLSRTKTQLAMADALAAEYRRRPDRRILAKITVLGSFIKRRKDMVLSLESAPTLSEERLSSALDESCRALGTLGVRGTYLVRTGELDGEAAAEIYDFFEAVIEAALDRARFISARVTRRGERLRAAILLDEKPPETELFARFPNISADYEDGAQYILEL